MTRTSAPLAARSSFPLIALLATAIAACRPAVPSTTTQPDARGADSAPYEPSRALGSLFDEVQRARVFPDGKTFVDARPLQDPAEIVARYVSAAHSMVS